MKFRIVSCFLEVEEKDKPQAALILQQMCATLGKFWVEGTASVSAGVLTESFSYVLADAFCAKGTSVHL